MNDQFFSNQETQQANDLPNYPEANSPVYPQYAQQQNFEDTSNLAQDNKKKKKKIIIIVGAIVAALGVVGLCIMLLLLGILGIGLLGADKDLSKEYESVASGYDLYATLSEDEKSITIDTNPYDLEDYSSSTAVLLVMEMNEALDLPDSVYDKMLETSALDGRVSEVHGDIRVSWKYHPDYGLQVTYELVD